MQKQKGGEDHEAARPQIYKVLKTLTGKLDLDIPPQKLHTHTSHLTNWPVSTLKMKRIIETFGKKIWKTINLS